MQHALVTWSDRGAAGPPPAHHVTRRREDVGPILRLLSHWEGRPRYKAIWILTTPSGELNARALVEELRSLEGMGSVQCSVLPVNDPSDHSQLFQALGPALEHIESALPAQRWSRDVILSAGTPQMQTLWVILVQAGLFAARMLQVIPEAFVPDPHPSPVREVRLDTEGFPEIRALRDEVKRLRAAVEWHQNQIVGISSGMRSLEARTQRIAASDLPVLILGETGTGKELVARALHQASPRASGPFIAENCAALSDGLLASELFGHEAGAYTGAVSRKRGLFEMAHGGTLFLDEVGDMPANVQAHLLRVLQEGRLRRVGGETTVRVDVRLVTATHRDLQELMQQGTFRADLFYRLRGATLELPPLRERREDLGLLVDHFLQAEPTRKLTLAPEVWERLTSYAWPGNVRELRAEVLRWKALCQQRVELADLSSEIGGLGPRRAPPNAELTPPSLLTLADSVRAAESQAIRAADRVHQGNLSRMARALGVDRNTLKRKLAAHGMRELPDKS